MWSCRIACGRVVVKGKCWIWVGGVDSVFVSMRGHCQGSMIVSVGCGEESGGEVVLNIVLARA